MKVTLQGPDDLGHWFLARRKRELVPPRRTPRGSPGCRRLFGWTAPEGVTDEEEIIQDALDWLNDHINDEIEAPAMLFSSSGSWRGMTKTTRRNERIGHCTPSGVASDKEGEHSMDAFTRQYILTALWSSMDNADEQGGEPLDANYGIDDLAPETLASIKEDCEAFQRDNTGDIGDDVEQAGHDFWLTRNHHGAGFWDGDWPHEAGERLTTAAHVYGSVDLYVGDNGLIYG